MDQTPVAAAEVLAELDRILASRGFASATRLSRLLRHVVERTLAGEGGQLKEYALGVEVFDRDEHYDPRLDSIVRVEAGRLRTKLAEYYEGDGARSAIRVALPKGSYVPQWTLRPEVEAAAPAGAPLPFAARVDRRGRRSQALGVGLLLLTATAVVWLAGGLARPAESGRPGIAVLAFEHYSLDAEQQALAARITDGVSAELARLGTLDVRSRTSAQRFAGRGAPLREIAEALHADAILEASIETEAAAILVVARVVDARIDRKFWVGDFEGTSRDVRALERDIAAGVNAAVLARFGAGAR